QDNGDASGQRVDEEGVSRMTLSVGLSVTPQDPHWLELAREAERLGVDSIWVPEFWAYDAFTPLAAIAARTDRVRLATRIAQLGGGAPATLALAGMGPPQNSR